MIPRFIHILIISFFLSPVVKAQEIIIQDIIFNKTIEIGEENLLQIGVINNGAETITELWLAVQFNNQNKAYFHIENIALDPTEINFFKLDNYVFFEEGSYELKLNIWTSFEDVNNEVNEFSFQFDVLNKTYSKNLHIEHFTNSSCYSCTNGNENLFSILKKDLAKTPYTHIAYHTSWPGYDPFYNYNLSQNIENARVDYYQILSVPRVIIEGNRLSINPANLSSKELIGVQNLSSIVEVLPNAYLQNNSINLDLQLKSKVSNEDEYLLFAILNQDKLYYNAPGTNGEIYFPNAMRLFITDINGDTIRGFKKDEIIQKIYSIDNNDFSSNDTLNVAVFIQNSKTKEIVQSKQIAVQNENQLTLISYPENNSSQIGLTDSVVLSFNSRPLNSIGEEISNFKEHINLTDNQSNFLNYNFDYNDQKNLLVIKTENSFNSSTNYKIEFEDLFNSFGSNLSLEPIVFTTLNQNPELSIEKVSIDHRLFFDFDPNIFQYNFPIADTSSQVPIINLLPSFKNVKYIIHQATSIPGYAEIKIYKENSTDTLNYRFNFYPTTLSSNAQLISVSINNEVLTEFNSNIYSYDIVLEDSNIPEINFTKADENSSVEVEKATTIPGSTILKVTAENRVSQQLYSFNFEMLNFSGIFEKQFALYPNPVTDYLNIDIKYGQNLERIIIYDIAGNLKKQIQVQTENHSYKISFKEFQAGIYLISLHSDKGIIHKKIIVE